MTHKEAKDYMSEKMAVIGDYDKEDIAYLTGYAQGLAKNNELEKSKKAS